MNTAKQLLNKTVKVNNAGFKMEGKVVDYTANGEYIHIEANNDYYQLRLEDITVEEVANKSTSATIEFDSNADSAEKTSERIVDILIISDDEDTIDNIIEKLVEECDYLDLEESGVAVDDYEDRLVGILYMRYEHGSMTEAKKDIKREFKSIKKEMGIK